MPIYTIEGYLWPSQYKIDFPINAHLPWTDSTGFETKIEVSIKQSQVRVILDTPHIATVDQESQMCFRALDCARLMTGCYSFITGLGLRVILTKMIKPGGVESPMVTTNPNLAKLSTAYTFNAQSYEQMVLAMGNHIDDLFVLNDLIDSILAPHGALVNCARAVEGIRLRMTPEGFTKKQGWEEMRRSLRIDHAYLKFITDQSEGPRHADRSGVNHAEYRMTLERSWTVMNRYLEYKKRGNQPLPEAEFELLT